MEFKKLREQNVGTVTEKVIQLKKNHGKITINDINNVIAKFITDGTKQYGKDNFKISLIKVNAGKWVTFTSQEKFNDYFENKVKDPTKFYEFDEAHFYIQFE
jgi:hypothetical protein